MLGASVLLWWCCFRGGPLPQELQFGQRRVELIFGPLGTGQCLRPRFLEGSQSLFGCLFGLS